MVSSSLIKRLLDDDIESLCLYLCDGKRFICSNLVVSKHSIVIKKSELTLIIPINQIIAVGLNEKRE